MADETISNIFNKTKRSRKSGKFPLTCKVCSTAKCEGRKETCEACNKERRKQINAEYWAENRDRLIARTKQRRRADPEKTASQHRKYYQKRSENFKEKLRLAGRARYRRERDARILRSAEDTKRRRALDPEGEKAKARERMRRRRQDVTVVVSGRMSNRIWCALKRNGGKKRPWLRYVDYTVSELIERLNETMPEGYGWQDFMRGDLHIDHIRPVAAHKFDSPEHPEFKACWALSNLQLLPAAENIRKNARLDWQPESRGVGM